MALERVDILIIGSGFYGAVIGEMLARRGQRVLICEKGEDMLLRASWANQARIHNGYHYPRSVLTALRSRINFPRFVKDYADCVVSDFEKYYAVPREFSKVTAAQFADFMRRIGAPIRSAPKQIANLFNPDRIERVFSVTEYAFDADVLRETMRQRLDKAGVEIRFRQSINQVEKHGEGLLAAVQRIENEATYEVLASKIFNCTYSGLNHVLENSGCELIPLKHELTEMALIEPPEPLRDKGITVMCGPFFSVMPFPPRGLHTLSHVRYTPHCWWRDEPGRYEHPHLKIERAQKKSRYEHMVRAAAHYLPCIRESSYRDSIWEVKTVLPRSEVDDSRPILQYSCREMPGLTSILGGKIDNVFDILDEFDLSESEHAL